MSKLLTFEKKIGAWSDVNASNKAEIDDKLGFHYFCLTQHARNA